MSRVHNAEVDQRDVMTPAVLHGTVLPESRGSQDDVAAAVGFDHPGHLPHLPIATPAIERASS